MAPDRPRSRSSGSCSTSSAAGCRWGETAHGFAHAFSSSATAGSLGHAHLLPLFFLVNFRSSSWARCSRWASRRSAATSPATRMGREARARSRPGRGEGGDPAHRLALAVGRAVREGGRQARARPAVPRRAGHGQDDAREGDRDRLQLPLRDDPRLRLRADLRRHGLDHRPLSGAQGEAARAQVGRPVHRLHRRDRRRRHAAQRARRRCDVMRAAVRGADASSSRATSCSRPAPGGTGSSSAALPSAGSPRGSSRSSTRPCPGGACSAAAAAAGWR